VKAVKLATRPSDTDREWSEGGDQPLLDVSGLQVEFGSDRGPVHAVRGIDFSLRAGESVAILGESGSGKSVTGKAIMGLIDRPGRVDGSMRFAGRELAGLTESELRDVRGPGIAMVFQDSLDALNPVFSVGSQLTEILRVRLGASKREAQAEAIRLMNRVGIKDAEERIGHYPHQFSGGMRQRICIAMAIALQPQLLIADEPTTALDVTVQAGILRLIRRLQQDTAMALLFVTHDLAVARAVADRLIVMYAGQVVEQGPIDEIFRRPAHPYTRALMHSNPGSVTHWTQLRPIQGNPPDKAARFTGCAFTQRCPIAVERCSQDEPPLRRVIAGRDARCHLAEEVLDGV
jgi:oligopeptide transport system ATP-binding protein